MSYYKLLSSLPDLDYHLNPNSGASPNHRIMAQHHAETIALNILNKDDSGMTVLHHAAHQGLVFLCAQLSNAETCSVLDNFGFTALHCAAVSSNDHSSVIAALAPFSNLEARSHIGNTPLLCAASSGSMANVRALSELGANRQATSTRGGTLFHKAVEGKNIEVIEWALASCDPDAIDANGKTGFFYAKSVLPSTLLCRLEHFWLSHSIPQALSGTKRTL